MWSEEEFLSRNASIWKNEFESFVPERILDFHVHLAEGGILSGGEPFVSGGRPLTKYDAADFERDIAAVLPGRRVSAVCFGLPDPRHNWRANNAYVASLAGERYVPFRMFDPRSDTPEALRAELAGGRFRGLKPYPDFADPESPGSVEIRDMLPEWCMEIANEMRLVIMLHIPRRARLADRSNQEQVAECARMYPNARIVLAHVGRAYFMKNVTGNLDRFAGFPNVFVDIAMLNNWEVLEYVFSHFPSERILYGSDTPVALSPGKSVEINDGYTYVTPFPWELSITDNRGRVEYTSFLYEELRAVKKAVLRARMNDLFVEGLFHDNGARLLAKD